MLLRGFFAFSLGDMKFGKRDEQREMNIHTCTCEACTNTMYLQKLLCAGQFHQPSDNHIRMYYLSDVDGRVVLVAATHLPPPALALPDVLASPTQRKHQNHSLLPDLHSLTARRLITEQSLVLFFLVPPLYPVNILILSAAVCRRTLSRPRLLSSLLSSWTVPYPQPFPFPNGVFLFQSSFGRCRVFWESQLGTAGPQESKSERI